MRKWIKQRTWAKVLSTILIVLSAPIWLTIVVLCIPFLMAYDEIWSKD